MTDWHRLFGLLLMDFFTDSPFVVELEKDLSVQQQQLDVIIIRKLPGEFHQPLPDGFGQLADHNLVTFKSYQEALTAWSLQELISHYVTYPKLISLPKGDLVPVEAFRLMAVCVRFPQQLAGQETLHEVSAGVYNCVCLGLEIRIIVVHQLPQEEQNVLCHLFSAQPAQIRYGATHFTQRSPKTSSLIQQLLTRYHEEDLLMPYTLEDFERDFKEEYLQKLTPEERLKGLTREEIQRYLQNLEAQTPEDAMDHETENDDTDD